MTWYNPKKTNEIPPAAARHLEREKRKARQRKLVRTEDPPLCVKEAAHILDVSESTVYRMLRDGRLTKAKIINRTRVLKSEVERYKRDQVDNRNSPAELNGSIDHKTKQRQANPGGAMMVVDKKELLDLSHSICSKAADVIRKSAEQGTSAEKRARELMPMQLAHAFFIHLGRCRTEKSRVKELTLLAGICQAMAYELSLAKEVK